MDARADTTQAPIAAPEPTGTDVLLSASSTICFAMEQAGIPLIHAAVVRHYGPEILTDAELVLRLEPELTDPLRVPITTMIPLEEQELGVIDLRLPPGRLRAVEETERARLVWTLQRGEEVLASGAEDVSVLPYNQWPGLLAPPALLTSFVTPNHAVVAQLLKRVSERLGAATGRSALDGYQAREPGRVRAMLQALFEEIASLNLTYIEAPASFERSGQKVRLPDQVLSEQLACCLDLTVLFASCLEQMGLSPLIVVVKGHAFITCWLVDDRFPEGLVEDGARLRNQLDLGQMLALETTLVTGGGSFGAALAAGQKTLLDDERYRFSLDVRACRTEFRPLPLRQVGVAVEEGAAPTPQRIEIVRILREARAAPDESEEEAPVPEDVAARFRRWQDRLLDLTLRNKLLNFRPDRKEVLPLRIPDLPTFEDLLATGERLEIVGRPLLYARDERDERLVRARKSEEGEQSRLLDDLARRVIHSSLPQDRLERQTVELVRAARVDLEEGGACTLFVAIGLLKWLESGTGKERLAPLILYPVEITFDRQRRRVVLRRIQDEDPIANVTLIEKLRRDLAMDLSGLAQLDTDDAGLDVRKLLDGVRREIQAFPGFEVLEEVHAARFSFSKFLMWRDLEDNASQLLESQVVRHIAGVSSVWEDPVGDIEPASLDVSVPPGALPTVLDGDATQLAAVVAALRGRSFVLQGPPGTGKSQTITNLIAAAVAEGKSVLFVSEKMAALEVVHRRLQSVGLGDFCLELHSHKANKKEVLQSFNAVLERQSRSKVPGWEGDTRRLAELRGRLNAYAEVLHRKRPAGFTVYEASARLRALLDAPEVRYPLDAPLSLDAETIAGWKEAAAALADRGSAVEPLPENPWRLSANASYRVSDEEALGDAIAKGREWVGRAEKYAAELEASLGVRAPRSLSGLRQLCALAEATAQGALPAGARTERWSDLASRARSWLEADAACTKKKEALLQRWAPSIFERGDLRQLHDRYERWAGAFFLLAWIFLWGAKRRLRAEAREAVGDPQSVRDDLNAILACKQEQERLKSLAPDLQGLLDPEVLQRGDVVSGAFLLPQSEVEGLVQRSATITPERRAFLLTQHTALRTALDEVEQAEGRTLELARFAPGAAWPLSDDPTQLPRLAEALPTLQAALPRFRPHCLYREAAERLEALGHGALVAAHGEGQLAADQIPAALERNLLARWLAAVTDEEEVLRSFEARSQERLVRDFAELDRHHLELSRAYVVAQAEARLPHHGANIGEMQILRREIAKKTRQMAVRRLLQSLPELLHRLKPCLLMSPLSVAQYLPATARFDLVVFDEASQIGTHDAIGAIARGRQVVVVGDSRQLPPTAFFQRASDDENALPDENDVVELESVLEEAQARGLPQQMLGWHYRSRHDSLIDFSNRHYYDGRLFVFPAARQVVEDLGVKWHPVPEGVFLSGGDRTNPREAEVLVEHLLAQLHAFQPGERSFGVVTFSLAQRRLIEDMLDEARAKYPAIEVHFQSEEPVFVKNLENVQGDERDEILFSIGYAPDEEGRLRMHFGPLSIAGGERRLNVAITRARRQLRVFSTLRPEDIDLTRTASTGARHLRNFLQFARRGAVAVEAGGPQMFPSSFHREIHDALVAAGHRVVAMVGCAGYRVDLAVERPGAPGTYALGIELDGPGWASAETARDRERLRREVLGALGWRMVQVRVLEWARNPKGELERILTELQKSLDDVQEEPPPPPSRKVEVVEEPAQQGPPLEAMKRLPAVVYGTADDLPHATGKLRKRIHDVVNFEGPLHVQELARRVAEAWGARRVGARIARAIDEQVEALVAAKKIVRRGEFLWPRDGDPKQVRSIRLHEADGSLRPLEDLAPEEIALAAAWVRQAGGLLSEVELARETARVLGARRPTDRMIELVRRRLTEASG